MSSDFQNRLRKNLERPVPAEHPAPDVLNAYIEKVLTPAEERQVTEHLAACGECREVVSLATGAAEELAEQRVAAAPVMHVKRVRWWAWALPVAAVAVVASAVLLNQRELLAPKNANTQIAQARRDEPQAPPVSATNPTPGTPAPKTEAENKTDSLARYQAKRPAPAQPIGGLVATPAAVPSPTFERGELAKEKDANQPARNEIASGKLEAGRAAEETKPAIAMSAPAAAPGDKVQSLKQSQGAAETITADAEARDQFAYSTGSANSAVSADRATRSKAANLDTKAGQAFGGFSNNRAVAKKSDAAQWRVTAQGGLEHFLLGKWEPALADSGSHFLAIATYGDHIWVAGKNLALYHSPDNGSTWERQTLRVRIAADITQVVFTTDKEGVLTTNLGTMFVTHDGGKIWAQEK